MAELERTLGIDLWCWSLADPASLLGWSGVSSPRAVAHGDLLAWHLALEQHDDAVTRHGVALAPEPVATLAEATNGELGRSQRWLRTIAPLGMADLLVWACRDGHGCWGRLEGLRAADRPPFDHQDKELLGSLTALFGRALRTRAERSSCPSSASRAPGVLVLDHELRLASWTPSAPDWLAEFPGGTATDSGLLPSVVYAVAGRATAPASTARLGARALLTTSSGCWAVVEGAPLQGANHDCVAVTIRAAEPGEVAHRLARTCELTARERELAMLAARGLSTQEIASRLYLSPYTVKDHLKEIFAKTGVHSRRELAVTLAGGALG